MDHKWKKLLGVSNQFIDILQPGDWITVIIIISTKIVSKGMFFF